MKKQWKALNKAKTVTKTVMFRSVKIKTKKLTNCDTEEDWIEFIKKRTKQAEEHMKKKNIPCWIETHRRTKLMMTMR